MGRVRTSNTGFPMWRRSSESAWPNPVRMCRSTFRKLRTRSIEAISRPAGGCDTKLAQQVGAELAITGVVHKISNLILNMSIYVRDSRDGHLVWQMAASFRGNTDQSWSWSRALDWLVRKR